MSNFKRVLEILKEEKDLPNDVEKFCLDNKFTKNGSSFYKITDHGKLMVTIYSKNDIQFDYKDKYTPKYNKSLAIKTLARLEKVYKDFNF